jgi:membrane protease YdiL (CAAX protease family)
MRLGLFSLLVWLLTMIRGMAQGLPSTRILWTANILVALLFGLGHLPATAALVPLTPLIVIRAVALNGSASLVFGYLYWARGLEAAMLAHFTADVVLHAIMPLLGL